MFGNQNSNMNNLNNESDLLNDAATLMASSSSLLQQNESTLLTNANSNNIGSGAFSKGFVEHRRQMFEKTKSTSSSSSGTSMIARKGFETATTSQQISTAGKTAGVESSPTGLPKTVLSSHSFDYDTITLGDDMQASSAPVTSHLSAAHGDMIINGAQNNNSLSSVVRLSTEAALKPASLGIGEVTDAAAGNADSSPSAANARPPFSPFSHINRASYKGECRRLMSRTNMETVAERAAHFEDIDPDRYVRMKSKFEELEAQYEEDFKRRFGNQPPPLGFFMNQVNTNNINMLNSFVDSIMMLPASRSSSQHSSGNNGIGMKNESNVATSANANANSANNYFNADNVSNSNASNSGSGKLRQQLNSNNSFSPIYDDYLYMYDENLSYLGKFCFHTF
jgi:hypothetical protein